LILVVFWLPPRTEDKVVVLEASSLLEEDAVEQSFHTQHERFFPTLASTPVTMTKPTTNAIAPAIRLPIRMERRLAGAREANLENGCLSL
jgi:hypothetical protein